MKNWLAFFVIAFALAVAGCSDKKAREKYETAQFEELQKNYVHARELYQEIIKKYPESEYAKEASQRLKALKNRDLAPKQTLPIDPEIKKKVFLEVSPGIIG
jgi:outer membrane protein assembly factor BamD (BamD/ComL family)